MTTWARHLRLISTWDAALVVFLVATAVVEIVLDDLTRPGARIALAVLTIAGLLVRRSFPLLTAAMVTAGMSLQSWVLESPDELGVLLAVVLAAFAVGAYGSTADRVAGGLLLSLGVAVAVLMDPSDSASNVLPTLLLFVALPLALGLAFGRTHQDIAALQLETEALAVEADAAVDAERRRIARELHDVVAHAVTLIAVQAEAGSAVLDSDPEAARRSLDAIGNVSREALVELHRLLDLLGDGEPTQPDSGLERLPALVAGARAAGLTVEVSELGSARALPSTTDHCAYRILQEGLTNALRHASGSRVRLSLEYDDRRLALTVDSTGRRHTSAYGGTGRGLVGIRERVLAMGGTLSAGSTEGGGFRLHATLPLESV